MSTNQKFRRLFRLSNDRADVQRAVDDELQFHFDLAVRDLMAAGATEIDARREAERRFGDVERTRRGLARIDQQRIAESRRVEFFANLLQDLRYSLRGLRRKPMFSIAVVLILALGIGANATMFGIIDRLLLRAPNFLMHDGRVQRLYFATTASNKETFGTSTSYRRFHEITDSAPTIELAAATWTPAIAVGTTDARELRVTYASARFWQFFNATPVLGRYFTEAEDVPNTAANVAVLSYSYWNSAFGARTNVVGEHIRLGRLDYTIIGVTPDGFSGFGGPSPVAFIPLASGAENSFPGNGTRHWYDTYGLNWVRVMVRRKPDASLASATADLTLRFAQSRALQRTISAPTEVETARPHVVVANVLEERGPNRSADVKVTVWLVGVALSVLIIACANVSNLLLARALQRRREIAVRLALGISRRRLFAQLMAETALLAALGGVAGLLITEWGGRVLRATLVPTIRDTNTLTDSRTLLFTAGIAVLAGVFAGFAPAWGAGRASLSGALKAGSREGTYQHSRLRSALLVLQGALSVVLLVGAGLFVRSLNKVQSIPLGYDVEHLAWIQPELRGVKLDSARLQLMLEDVRLAARQAPGSLNASLAVMVPFYSDWEEDLFVAGIDSVGKLGAFMLQVVSPGYFETMGTRIVRGRGIATDDQPGSEKTMVVSESMARTLWPGQDALGKCVRVGADTLPCRRVVGIAEDIKYSSLTDDPGLQYYLPHTQYGSTGSGVFVRTSGNAASNVESIRRAAQRVMPGASYVTVTPLTAVLDPQQRSWRLGATMFTLFGVLALIVASVGLYSVIAYSVAQRTQEMGVRAALGAQTLDLVRMILSQSVTVALLAIGVGLGVALLAAPWVKPLLFNTSPHDPVVYSGVAAVLFAVAFVAGIVPALRASRVSPSVALRSD